MRGWLGQGGEKKSKGGGGLLVVVLLGDLTARPRNRATQTVPTLGPIQRRGTGFETRKAVPPLKSFIAGGGLGKEVQNKEGFPPPSLSFSRKGPGVLFFGDFQSAFTRNGEGEQYI